MTPEAAAELRKPFDAKQIGKLPKGGVLLDFVGHAAVTDRLLQVDPEWSWEPFAVDERGLPALDAEGNLWIRLTICGVTRIGVGDGKTKERIGDAIRNAAMRFGVALDLWSREDLTAPEPFDSEGYYGDTVQAVEASTDLDELRRFHADVKRHGHAGHLSDATAQTLTDLIAARAETVKAGAA